MKFFILATLIYFSYSIVFAMEDRCVTECSTSCKQQAKDAEKALESHLRVCKGEAPTLTEPECAQACSKGCKAVMRGQRQLIVEHYEFCGGGDGSMGNIQCINSAGGYHLMNTHSLNYIGDSFRTSWNCEEAKDTLDYNILCAKYASGYAVHTIQGLRLGEDSTFIYECVESIMTVRNDRLCLKVSYNRYGIYDLNTMQRVGKDYPFLSTCKQDL